MRESTASVAKGSPGVKLYYEGVCVECDLMNEQVTSLCRNL